MTSPSETHRAPFLSVVMPAYNAEAFIGEVIATILGQTFIDFELIIIDDGSTDGTADIIKSYAKIDSRVSYHHQTNQGSERLGETLNKAVHLAKANWIARADADDPWFLDKLQKQTDFIKAHPDYVLIGGGADVTNERGVLLYTLLGPIDDDDNRRAMTLYTTHAHGSVMFKKDIFEELGGYRNVHAAEDLDLWQRMTNEGKVYNIPEPLFRYRKNTQGISMLNQELQSKIVEQLGVEYFKTNTPKVISSKEMKKKLDSVNVLRKNSPVPVHLVDHMLRRLADDNVRIARLHVKYGNKKDGYRQLFNVATSGKLGMIAVSDTVKKNLAFKVSQLWRKS